METTTETTKIAEYSKTEAGLADLRQRFAGATYEVSTTAGMELARAGRAELKGLRVDVEKTRKLLKAPLLARGKEIDEYAERLTTEIAALEKPIDAQIKAEEDRREKAKVERERLERERLAAVTAAIEAIRRRPAELVLAPVEQIERDADRIRALDLAVTFDEVHRPAAAAAVTEALAALDGMIAARRAEEAERKRVAEERAELERWKAEQEKALDEERKRDAAARAEAEAVARAAREEAERAARVARAEADAAARAAREEADRKAAEVRAQLDAEARQRAEDARRDAEAAAIEKRRVEEEAARIQAEREELDRQRDVEAMTAIADEAEPEQVEERTTQGGVVDARDQDDAGAGLALLTLRIVQALDRALDEAESVFVVGDPEDGCAEVRLADGSCWAVQITTLAS